MNALLEVSGLTVEVPSRTGTLTIVDDVSFALEEGRTLGLVGESGSGKSLTVRAIIGILGNARVRTGSIKLGGRELVGLPERELRRVRGREIGMVFQEPMTALDPAYTIGEQIAEIVRTHERVSRRVAWDRAVDMLERVRIPSARQRARDYPHNFSGGMRQRAVIAMALSCNPSVLLADEPTTALDVTTQQQILDLLLELQQERQLGVVFVSHDLAVISNVADEVAVMYAGQLVETADVREIFRSPRHPYTQALMNCVPGRSRERLPILPGAVPDFSDLLDGCRFAPRCARAQSACHDGPVPLSSTPGGRRFRCINPVPLEEGVVV